MSDLWLGILIGIGSSIPITAYVTYKIIEHKLSNIIRDGITRIDAAKAKYEEATKFCTFCMEDKSKPNALCPCHW